MRAAWEWFWFRETSARGMTAARILVAANALWILLSRPDLVSLVRWPEPLWAGAGALRMRYGYFLPFGVESVLYWAACVALVCVLAGKFTRVSALIAGLLLYHLAPLENVISSRIGPFFNGFTLPVLALLILAFAPAPSMERSSDHRWPFALIQVLFAFTYLLAGASKLRYSGLEWVSGGNLESTIQVFNAFEPANRPLADFLLAHPAICTAIVVLTIVMELSLFAVLLWPRLGKYTVPPLVIGHVGIYLVLGVIFLNTPLVLLFLDWDGGG